MGKNLEKISFSKNLENSLSTFSIVAFDPENGDLGVGVQSKYFSVGPIVPWAESEVGAIATQAWVNVSYGSQGLKLLKEGLSVDDVIHLLTKADEGRDRRQMGIVDAKGNSASYTGPECTPWAGGIHGINYSVQGNILEGPEVLEAMAKKIEGSSGELAERLVASLKAGQEAGGDSRGRQSAALLVVRKGRGRSGYGDRYIDLRVEDHITPIKELKRLLSLNYSSNDTWRCHHLLDNGNIEEAIELAKRAIELSPRNDIAHMALCRAHYVNGEKSLAVEAFQKATELNEMTINYVKRIPRWSFIAKDDEFFKNM